jgi:hypothetical protein
VTAPTLLIVLAAFDRDPEGNLVPAFDPREYPDERRALIAALELHPHHAGVIAWKRTADTALGDYGPPEVIARYGDVPDME